MAGIGFDADVVTRHHLARVGRAGRMRPDEPRRLRRAGPPLELRLPLPGADGRRSTTPAARRRWSARPPSSSTCRGTPWACPSPRRPWATTAGSTWSSSADPGPFQALRYLWLVFRGIHLDRPGVYHRRVRRLSISCPEPAPVQLDGDPGGTILVDAEGPPGRSRPCPERPGRPRPRILRGLIFPRKRQPIAFARDLFCVSPRADLRRWGADRTRPARYPRQSGAERTQSAAIDALRNEPNSANVVDANHHDNRELRPGSGLTRA